MHLYALRYLTSLKKQHNLFEYVDIHVKWHNMLLYEDIKVIYVYM